MRWLLVGMLVVTLGLSVGCQRDRKKEMAQVPTVTSVRTDGTYATSTPDYTYAGATAAASGSPTPSTSTYGGNQYITLPSEPVPGTGVTVGHGAASTYTAGASYSANPATSTPSFSTTTYTSSDRIEAPGASSEPVFLGPTAAAPAAPATTTVTTLSATPAAPAAATPATGGTSYTVARGDTLWSIAQKHYGDGKRWQDIASANGISDARKLAVGQKIVLP